MIIILSEDDHHMMIWWPSYHHKVDDLCQYLIWGVCELKRQGYEEVENRPKHQELKLRMTICENYNCETQPPAWVALSSLVRRHRLSSLFSPRYDVSDHTNHTLSVRIWSWQRVSIIFSNLTHFNLSFAQLYVVQLWQWLMMMSLSTISMVGTSV